MSDVLIRERPEHQPGPVAPPRAIGHEAEWYKDAVIYQLHVKAFQDASGDGIGDFKGLIERLDYVQKLGATAIWLLPFYPSPLRDDGYDISDYRRINPAYGSMRDFRQFVKEAHRRGLRVITELVINHTSDQHPWFQRARHAKPGSAARNFYVWSDTDKAYEGTRIIFLDTETSNWTWDPVAKAYFWHRFYSHQPDLNFDNPQVLREVIKVMRFWLDMGVDGLRLDAIPYLIEREGTNNENLPETHEVLKKIRAALDEHYEDKMLLAEANQWPEDTAPYFGDGDECHMAFHFPLMPRIYMALAQEDRHPISDIVRQMPEIPDSCQWAIFLRNHDELTLEMVTEEERDYLWRTYAEDTRARINLGIRRRLAPLMQNDRRKIELMNALLLSMPGTPVLYYGDELGMGDNYFLGDRDGVRTPMQWTADRNGGFSRANPQALYLPPVMDPIYGFQAINVEAQEGNPSSLLHWMRRMVAVRRRHRAFGRGEISFLYPRNRKVLAYVREHEGEQILCVANLSRSPQAAELDLSAYHDRVPVELVSHTPFPPIGDLPYLLTLTAYGFYWFILRDTSATPDWHESLPEIQPEFVTLTAADGTIQSVLKGRERRNLENDVLPSFLPLQRWFADKQDEIRQVKVERLGVLDNPDHGLTIASVEGAGGVSRYFLPLSMLWGEQNIKPGAPFLSHTLAKVRKGPKLGALMDGAFDDRLALALMKEIRKGEPRATDAGRMEFQATDALRAMDAPQTARRMSGEQSNVSVVIDDAIVLKIYRRLRSGLQPDVEVGRFLTEVAGFDGTPPYLGSATLLDENGEPVTLASAFAFAYNQGDAWSGLLEALTHDLELEALSQDDRDETFAYPLMLGSILGRRTAELHLAFAHPTDDPAFSSEPVTADSLEAWSDETAGDIGKAITVIRRYLRNLPEDEGDDMRALVAGEAELMARVHAVKAMVPAGHMSRIHGDYHLGQVLLCQDDVMIVDFEGEPHRTLDERRRKSSPLRDVAGMLRSFDYLTHVALDRRRVMAGTLSEAERLRAMGWRRETTSAFLDAYFAVAGGEKPDANALSRALLDLFTLQKAAYEVVYEAANRPAWLSIPVSGILDILKQDPS
ncbi:maltose alpha-D-glucosyltransferase [Breoghania sp. JC706]|uniref:maltose alpha-D-glucosyltransferase n=1 Tax=Breoghania sp. JC706 TaxID=3117732 RepID=UPI00300A32BF